MTTDVFDLVTRLHACDRRVVLAVTGGAATAAAWLLAVPGASRSVVEVVVPYDQRALEEFLGHAPSSYCSAETAHLLARRARERATWLAGTADVVGVGGTASLRSDRPKRGDHRVHVATASARGITTYSLTLAKEQRTRQGEEELASRILLNGVAAAFDLPHRLPLELLPGEALEEKSDPSSSLLARLLRGDVVAVCAEPDGRLRDTAPLPGLLLPGSFNPLHQGHRQLAAVVSRKLQRPAAFELSVTNVEKATLDEGDLRRRVTAFASVGPVWLTRAPTFVDKARLFPATCFVVGADTAARIVQPRFYGDSSKRMEQALTELRQRGARFLVAGRSDGKQFVELAHLAIPAAFADLFEGLPPSEFRADVSSTVLRALAPWTTALDRA